MKKTIKKHITPFERYSAFLLLFSFSFLFEAKAQNLKDSIPHVSSLNLNLQIIDLIKDTLPHNHLIIYDSLGNKLIDIDGKNSNLIYFDKSKVFLLRDTSYLVKVGDLIYSDSNQIAVLTKNFYIDYFQKPKIDIQMGSESFYNTGVIEGYVNNKYNRTNLVIKLLNSKLPIEGGYLFNTDNSISNPLLGLYLKVDIEKYLLNKKINSISPNTVIPKKDIGLITSILPNKEIDSLTKFNGLDSAFQFVNTIDSISNKGEFKYQKEIDSKRLVKENNFQNKLIDTALQIKDYKGIIKKNKKILVDTLNLPEKSILSNQRINKLAISRDSILLLKQKSIKLFHQGNVLTKFKNQDYGDLPLDLKQRYKPGADSLKESVKIPKLGLRAFELGRIFPDYGPLIINNYSLTGVRTGITASKLSLDGFVGIHFQQNEGEINRSKKLFQNARLYGVQAKFKVSSGIQVFGSFLAAMNQNAGDYNRLTVETINAKPIKSEVIGLGLLYKLSTISSFRLDWARSLQSANHYSLNLEEKANAKMVDAFSINIFTGIKKSRTKIEALFRKMDPYFYSPGLPFLRNDIISSKLKLLQPFLKGNLNCLVNYEFNKDNTYHIKATTFQTNIILLKINIKLKRKVSLSLLGSQNFQKSYGEITSFTSSKLYQGTISKTIKSLRAFNSYFISYSFLEIQNPGMLVQQHVYSIISTHNFMSQGLTLSNTICGMQSSQSDTVGYTMAEIQFSKSIKSWLSISAGVNGTESNLLINRLRLFCTINLKLGKFTISPYFENYWIYKEKNYEKNNLYKINFALSLQL